MKSNAMHAYEREAESSQPFYISKTGIAVSYYIS